MSWKGVRNSSPQEGLWVSGPQKPQKDNTDGPAAHRVGRIPAPMAALAGEAYEVNVTYGFSHFGEPTPEGQLIGILLIKLMWLMTTLLSSI